jgi:hypothetical protein
LKSFIKLKKKRKKIKLEKDATSGVVEGGSWGLSPLVKISC